MNEVIWKYELKTGYNRIEMHVNSEVLNVDIDQKTDLPCLWVKVDTDKPTVERIFHIYGTGHKIGIGVKYIGTFQLPGGDFIGHVFEEVK